MTLGISHGAAGDRVDMLHSLTGVLSVLRPRALGGRRNSILQGVVETPVLCLHVFLAPYTLPLISYACGHN